MLVSHFLQLQAKSEGEKIPQGGYSCGGRERAVWWERCTDQRSTHATERRDPGLAWHREKRGLAVTLAPNAAGTPAPLACHQVASANQHSTATVNRVWG